MKKLLALAALALAGMAFGPAFADAVYPVTTPIYTPSAISPVQVFSAPGTYAVTLHNRSVVAFEINGTCTGVTATVQATVDGVTWRAVNVYPMTTGVIAAAANIVAAGAYRSHVAGARSVRLNISALTAACNISASATEAGVALTL